MSEQPERIMPPLGCEPRFIAEERRLADICGAIARYHDAQMKYPLAWLQEARDLTSNLVRMRGE
jgi:hypothetical protein